jgi:23S rRNA (uridine2552-2'-O)-methyltransferase
LKKHRSNKHWLHEHHSDPYVRQARQQGYRSRAAYKLIEIDDRDRLLRPGSTVVDLGAAPGGWSQVAAQRVGEKGLVVAFDILPMDPIPGVCFIQGDFHEQAPVDDLLASLCGRVVDLVISDMAPNISGMAAIDQPRSMYLAELALEFARKVLGPGSDMLIKVFQGSGVDSFTREMRSHFVKTVVRKPRSSRSRSREIYLLGRGFQGS